MEHPAEKAFLLIVTVVAMVGMGSTLTVPDLRAIVKQPRAILVGMGCQFGLLPLLAFGLAHLFRLPDALALGLILVACSPGGLASNLLTYYARGNVALSISMTAVSSTTSCVAMPALLWLYASPFTSQELKIPYGQIAAGLAILLVPVATGAWVRHRSPQRAAKLERLGGLIGLVVLAYLTVAWLIRHGRLLGDSDGSLLASCVLLTSVAFGAAYGAARLAGLGARDRATVSIETGVQNATLTLTIIALAFAPAVQAQVLRPPLLYGFTLMVIGIGATLVFRARGFATDRSLHACK